MSHDIFISYSHKDKAVADAACAALEAQGVRCWIAPRDISPGAEWGGAIVEAINNCRAMVLIFSAHANDSPQIRREVERAVNKEVPILPFRIENVEPTQSLEYFIGTLHWLDAVTPPMEAHLAHLTRTVKALLEVPALSSEGGEAAPRRPVMPPPEGRQARVLAHRPANLPMWIVAGCAVVILGLIGLKLATGTPPIPAEPPDAASHAGVVPHPAFPSAAVWTGNYIGENGPVPFQMTLTFKEDGTFTGRSTEAAPLGDRSSPVFKADISGQVIGTSVTFTKHFDGTGGVTQTAQYRGTIDDEHSAMSGTWSNAGHEGTFAATVEDPDDPGSP